MLRRCPVEISREIYLSSTAGSKFSPSGTEASVSVLKRLSAVAEKRSKEPGKFVAGAFLAACCFALMEVSC